MEIEKLKDMLRNAAGGPVRIQMCQEAADALEQLQAENDRLKKERDEAVIDMTALTAGHCCDLCAVEYCIVRGKTEICATFKWRGPMEESPEYRISNVGRPSACTTQDVSTVSFHKEGAGDTFVLYPVKEGES